MSEAPSLIDLLSRAQPTALASLRNRYPSQGKLLSSERLLTAEVALPPTPLEPEKRAAVRDLVLTSMVTLAADLDALAKNIREIMKKVSAIRFVGSLIASISGGLAGILIIALSNDVIQAITAFVAMLGGIASITADQFERAPSGIRIASADEYGKIIEMRSNIEMIRLKLQRDNIVPVDDQDIGDMLAQLDRYAAGIIKLKMA
jgi:hypothetical protein